MQPLLLLTLLLFTFPPGNQRFSSFLQNDNRNKALGSQVPRSSWGPRCPSCLLSFGCAFSSNLSTWGPVSKPTHSADHRIWPLLKSMKPCTGSWVGEANRTLQERVRVALCCSTGLTSHRSSPGPSLWTKDRRLSALHSRQARFKPSPHVPAHCGLGQDSFNRVLKRANT